MNNKKHGIEKWYYGFGALMREIPYINGKEEGSYKQYYSSGAIESETTYVNGRKRGIKKKYHGTGMEEELWINGFCLHCPIENVL